MTPGLDLHYIPEPHMLRMQPRLGPAETVSINMAHPTSMAELVRVRNVAACIHWPSKMCLCLSGVALRQIKH